MGNRARRSFKASDGYSVGDFLHYGIDNLAASELLFRKNARYFDSGGYLAHLGFELLLKAWHLHTFGRFEEGHHLEALWDELLQDDRRLRLEKRNTETLKKIHAYFSLRYPNPKLPQEIGSDDLSGILRLEKAICSQMPAAMQDIMKKLSGTRKGGRDLKEEPL